MNFPVTLENNYETKIFGVDFCLIERLVTFILKKPQCRANNFPSIFKEFQQITKLNYYTRIDRFASLGLQTHALKKRRAFQALLRKAHPPRCSTLVESDAREAVTWKHFIAVLCHTANPMDGLA